MEERPKHGTSIKHPCPSELDITTNHLTLRTQELKEISKFIAPTQNGGKLSILWETNSST